MKFEEEKVRTLIFKIIISTIPSFTKGVEGLFHNSNSMFIVFYCNVIFCEIQTIFQIKHSDF